MSNDRERVRELFAHTGTPLHAIEQDDVAHVAILHHEVIGQHLVPGFEVQAQQTDDGIRATVRVRRDTTIEKPVHLCFGMTQPHGIQHIIMEVDIEENAAVAVWGHCVFPNADDLQHLMDARIRVHAGASYSYKERHIHGESGGITVRPKADVVLSEDARFSTEFDLLRGRVGTLDIDYTTTCAARSFLDMKTKVSAYEDDKVHVSETGYLGESARGLLTSKIAVRDRAEAQVYNKLVARGAYARGHVDCKEIIQDNGTVSAVPIVEVTHPQAHITHEAAVGSADSKQVETLMARGLSEEQAVEAIIQGMLQS